MRPPRDFVDREDWGSPEGLLSPGRIAATLERLLPLGRMLPVERMLPLGGNAMRLGRKTAGS